MAYRAGSARLVLGAVAVLAVLALVVLVISLDERPQRASPAAGGQGMDAMAALSGEDQAGAYPRITGPEPLEFPRDHGPHPAYRHEWWYVTGNVTTAAGRHFGFQATLFRFNIAPDPPQRRSDLATNQVWMAHMAITDTREQAFHDRERFVRGAAGLAGGTAQPLRVHAEDWVMQATDGDGMPLTLSFPAGELGLQMRLTPAKPRVLQGDDGYSRKGAEPGNASRYYSYTRLAAEGTVRVAGQDHAVTGSAWLDREWGTSSMGSEQQGWDWFALQLDDGRDVMFYQLRGPDGAMHPRSAGVVVAADGAVERLTAEDVTVTVRRHWRGPQGRRYPVDWRLRIPEHDLDLGVTAVLDDQALSGAFRYWEGAVRVAAKNDGPAGRGYVELTGYEPE